MPIYKIQNDKVSLLKEFDFPKEKEMHDLIEKNLKELFGLDLIKGEFEIEGFYIDSLAFDTEVNSFVILEYKKDSNFSVVDQGLHYLSLMLNHKANFVLEYVNKTGKTKTVKDFDWSSVKVIFVAKNFTQYQKGATNFKDFPIELWELSRYEKDWLDLRQVQSSKKAETITKITKNKSTSKVISEIKTYSVEDHFKKAWTKSRELYEEIRNKFMSINAQLVEDPKKFFIGFKIGRLNVFSITPRKDFLIFMTRTKIKNPSSVIKHVKSKGLSNFYIRNENDINYALDLAKQSLESFLDKHTK